MHSKCLIKADNAQMPLWSNRFFSWDVPSLLLGQAAKTMGPKLTGKYQIFEIQENASAILGILELLSELHPKIFSKTHTILQIVEKRRKSFKEKIRQDQRGSLRYTYR